MARTVNSARGARTNPAPQRHTRTNTCKGQGRADVTRNSADTPPPPLPPFPVARLYAAASRPLTSSPSDGID